MSEIEQAIAYLERWLPFWKERNEDSALYVELALSALREKAEREKGCEFCKKFDFSEASAKVEKGKFAHIHLVCGNTRYPKEEQFNFCPMCGRKLKEVQA